MALGAGPDVSGEALGLEGMPDIRMVEDIHVYNLATIQDLLLAAFTAEELKRFCRDRPTLHPILYDLSPNASLNQVADQIITHCEHRSLFGELLAEIERVNPQQYQRFEPDLRFVDTQHASPRSRGVSKGFQVEEMSALECTVRNFVLILTVPLMLAVSVIGILEHRENTLAAIATRTAVALAMITPSSTPTSSYIKTPTPSATPPTLPATKTPTRTPVISAGDLATYHFVF